MLRELTRPTDLAARLGGDEFALWLEGMDAEGAGTRAEALCRATTALTLPLVGVPGLSFSVGGAVCGPRTETPEALLALADTAMYAAKHAGRNRWVVAAPEAAPSLP
jgi:diguanylate cyclase (GGDEF)-like protein